MHHIVRHGESLHKIAKHYHTHIHHLIHMNPHLQSRPNLIYPGESIRVR